MATRETDYAVIGGGIAGASAAYELAANGDVVLLEREDQFGFHTTGRSAAVFSETYGPPVVCALSRDSRSFLERPPEGFCDYPLLSPCGSLHLGRDGDEATLEALIDVAQRLCVEAQLLDAAGIRRRVPVLRPESARLGVFEPGAANIDVNGLHQAWLRGARRRGAETRTSAVVSRIDRSGDRWRLPLGDDVIEARYIINAAGAWADHVAELAGLRPLGVAPLRRTAALVKTPAGIDASGWPLVIAADESFYFKPDAGLLLVSPADETPSSACDAWPEDMDVAIGLDRVMQATTLQIDRVVRAWAGLRSFAPDRAPVVGPDPAEPSFIWAAGQGGYGIQTAPAISRLVAAICRGETAAGIDLAAILPERFNAP